MAEMLVDGEESLDAKSSVAADTLADDCTSVGTLAALDWENLADELQSSSEAFHLSVSGVRAYSRNGPRNEDPDGSLVDFLDNSNGFANLSLPLSTPTSSTPQREELKYPDPLHQSKEKAETKFQYGKFNNTNENANIFFSFSSKILDLKARKHRQSNSLDVDSDFPSYLTT